MKIVCYTFVKNVTSTQQNAIDMAYSILFETKLTFHTSKIIILLDLTVFLILNYNFT
jgi:hypothetical protein